MEETVKKLDGKPVKLSADDELLVSEMSKDIEEVFDVSLDELFTYDMNENIDFSEFEDNVIVLEEIDEETPQKRELDNLIAEDLPIDYIPTQKETEYYDPFEGTLQGKYSIEESKELGISTSKSLFINSFVVFGVISTSVCIFNASTIFLPTPSGS